MQGKAKRAEIGFKKKGSTEAGPAGTDIVKLRKPIRWKSGTVALRQIRKLQGSTRRLIPKASIFRLISEIVQAQSLDLGCSVTQVSPKARDALWTECEAYLQEVFKATQAVSVMRGGITITPKDMKHVRQENEAKVAVFRNFA